MGLREQQLGHRVLPLGRPVRQDLDPQIGKRSGRAQRGHHAARRQGQELQAGVQRGGPKFDFRPSFASVHCRRPRLSIQTCFEPISAESV